MPSIPSGIVATSGSVQYQHSSQLPFLDSLTVNGSLTSRQLDVREKQIRTQVRNVAAHYSLQNGNLSIQQARANLLGGAANGDIVIHNIGGNSRCIAECLAARNFDGKRAAAYGPLAATNDVTLRGALNGTVQAKWGRTLDDLVAQTTLSIRGDVSNVHAEQRSANPLPISGVVHGTYQRCESANQTHQQLPPDAADLPHNEWHG